MIEFQKFFEKFNGVYERNTQNANAAKAAQTMACVPFCMMFARLDPETGQILGCPGPTGPMVNGIAPVNTPNGIFNVNVKEVCEKCDHLCPELRESVLLTETSKLPAFTEDDRIKFGLLVESDMLLPVSGPIDK